MKLKEILGNIPIVSGTADMKMEISGVCYDSRKIKPGALFVAIEGYAVDGHKFIPNAVNAGAGAVLCRKPPDINDVNNVNIPYIITDDTRKALSLAGANWFYHPADALHLTAVTGTCGKTTTTYFIKFILDYAGHPCGLIGTNQNLIRDIPEETDRTTPESFEVQRLFARMRDAGCTHAVMETSSHSLFEHRVYGVKFQTAVFTNLSQDHLDFHKTMENYCDAKAILFQNCETGVVNADDLWTERILKNATCSKIFTFGIENPAADLRAENIKLYPDSIAFEAVTSQKRIPVRVGIPGRFMVYNTLAALAAALQSGVSLETAAAALEKVPRVKGRVEVVPTPGKNYTVLIDYAHTPDSMINVLKTLRESASGRIITVFGCGGDRDRAKRPLMGRAAADWSDCAIITTDNPRTEKPEDIIQDILPGFADSFTPCIVEVDREKAIRRAMDMAGADDIILLCGKGHETYQEVGHEKRHMDEREIVAACLS